MRVGFHLINETEEGSDGKELPLTKELQNGKRK
jgi:hypothetical protein